MRTTGTLEELALNNVGQLVEGRHENPFDCSVRTK